MKHIKKIDELFGNKDFYKKVANDPEIFDKPVRINADFYDKNKDKDIFDIVKDGILKYLDSDDFDSDVVEFLNIIFFKDNLKSVRVNIFKNYGTTREIVLAYRNGYSSNVFDFIVPGFRVSSSIVMTFNIDLKIYQYNILVTSIRDGSELMQEYNNKMYGYNIDFSKDEMVNLHNKINEISVHKQYSNEDGFIVDIKDFVELCYNIFKELIDAVRESAEKYKEIYE